jgi:hypothetical protein
MTDRLAVARERFLGADDLAFIRQRIDLIREPDISGYRGAAPLDGDTAEAINLIYPPPPEPAVATILAADGSQIYPDEQAPVHYYLLNTGLFVFYHGRNRLPEQHTTPELAYHKTVVHDPYGRPVSSQTVDVRRSVAEMRQLASAAWAYRDQTEGPLVTLYDNHLLFWANNDVIGSEQAVKDYQAALVQLHDAGAILGGYIDNPHRGRVVLRLLFLLSLKDENEVRVRQNELAQGGDLEGLRDKHLFNSLLKPGERTAVMVQNSPRNLIYKQRGPSYEIAFFYVKVGTETSSNLARIDLPVWVARERSAVDALHALILSQCRMQGRNPYPYALTRADELARVTGRDRARLDEMINLELRRKGIDPAAVSAKSRGKLLAHSDQRQYEMRSDINHPF